MALQLLLPSFPVPHNYQVLKVCFALRVLHPNCSLFPTVSTSSWFRIILLLPVLLNIYSNLLTLQGQTYSSLLLGLSFTSFCPPSCSNPLGPHCQTNTLMLLPCSKYSYSSQTPQTCSKFATAQSLWALPLLWAFQLRTFVLPGMPVFTCTYSNPS